MDAFILLADAATPHPDGTFSLLRGGIDRVSAPAEPIHFQGTLVARIAASLNESGKHDFAIRCTSFDGKQVVPPIRGGFVVPENGGGTHFIVGFSLAFPHFGKYSFALLIDNQEKDSWVVTATKVQGAEQEPRA